MADYTISCGLGVKIYIEDAKEAYKKYATKKRGCGHALPSGSKFCAICGKPAYIIKELHKYEIVERLQDLGFDVEYSTDMEYLVVGLSLGTVDGESMEPAKVRDIDNDEFSQLGKSLKQKLQPLGLYDAKTYGPWLVPYCSY